MEELVVGHCRKKLDVLGLDCYYPWETAFAGLALKMTEVNAKTAFVVMSLRVEEPMVYSGEQELSPEPKIDPSYSSLLSRRAISVCGFADKYRGAYSNGLKSYVCPFYCSYYGYKVVSGIRSAHLIQQQKDQEQSQLRIGVRLWRGHKVFFCKVYNKRDWDDILGNNLGTVWLGEYKCKGRGADLRRQVPWAISFRDEEARPFLDRNFINGDRWLQL
ncbi:hypothetical protein IFM89_035112 [Coptis chinensis]|uniref:Pectinesterase n=1 Tax=Coptis chinensis TaxID=261450 RepID=A0A835M317_9MAGN|nr:hypothetical protein IFM89_035112 [Coptis chinensis]